MTKNHPINPPPEIVDQLWGQCSGESDNLFNQFATLMARWGADQELEACCEYITGPGKWFVNPKSRLAELRAARRPKPTSLAEEALAVVENSAICDHLSSAHETILRHALERLQELEQNN